MLSKEEIAQNIISAMKALDMTAITEGSLYKALFYKNLDADEATDVVKYALDNAMLVRNGHVFILNANGKKDPSRKGPVCDSR